MGNDWRRGRKIGPDLSSIQVVLASGGERRVEEAHIRHKLGDTEIWEERE